MSKAPKRKEARKGSNSETLPKQMAAETGPSRPDTLKLDPGPGSTVVSRPSLLRGSRPRTPGSCACGNRGEEMEPREKKVCVGGFGGDLMKCKDRKLSRSM